MASRSQKYKVIQGDDQRLLQSTMVGGFVAPDTSHEMEVTAGNRSSDNCGSVTFSDEYSSDESFYSYPESDSSFGLDNFLGENTMLEEESDVNQNDSENMETVMKKLT